MALNLTINGVTYVYPEQGDNFLWGTGVEGWAAAVTSGALFKSGGLFQLTAQIDFGSAFGIKSLSYMSRSAAIANSGIIQLGNTDSIVWAGTSGGDDVALTVVANNCLMANQGLDAAGIVIANVATPTVSTQAATKGYVDAANSGMLSYVDAAIANANVAPAGSNGDIQFNNGADGLGASPNLTFDLASNTLSALNVNTNALSVNTTSVALAHRDAYINVGLLTASSNINCAAAVYQDLMLIGNWTIGLQNAAPAGQATTVTLYVRQSQNGANTLTIANTIWWSDDSTPTLSSTKNTADMFTFTTMDGGNIWLGIQVMGNVALGNTWF